MQDIFSKLNGGEILGLCGIVLGLIAVLGGLALGFATMMAVYNRRVQLDDMEATLKMEMIQRGMSAAEIKQVLEAKTGPTKTTLAEIISSLPQLRMRSGLGKQAANS
jgi:hypothetical protein